jgi:hypothetical protein
VVPQGLFEFFMVFLFGAFIRRLIPWISAGFSSDFFEGIMGECLVTLYG